MLRHYFALRGLLILLLLLNVLACQPEGQEETNHILQQTIENQQTTQVEPEDEVLVLEEDQTDNTTSNEVSIEEEYKPEKEVHLVPIEVTKDDDDLKNDSDDLPAEVELYTEREKAQAYAYADYYPKNTERNNLLDEAENAARGLEEEEEESSSDVFVEPKGEEVFFVVAGVFKDESNATDKMDTLIKKGYTPYLIKFESLFHTVCVSKLKVRSKADNLVTELEDLHNLDAYVVKRRQ